MSGLAVFEFEAAEESEVDMRGEPFALFSVVVGFHAVVAGGCVGIEVDADEDGIAILVCDGGSLVEGEVAVGSPGHGDGHTTVLEEFFDFFGNTKSEVLLVDSTSVSTFIFSSVASINDDP